MDFKEVQGVEVPEIGFGTYKLIGKQCGDCVRRALDLGYRHIDTAQFYRNEMEVGQAIRDSHMEREELFVTTKIWHTNMTHSRVLTSTEESLRSLDMDYVDLLLIHWPNLEVDIRETLDAMLILRDQGKALNIGVSNFPIRMLREIVDELNMPIFCNQVEYHPFLGQFDLLDYAAEQDLLVTAYSPLAVGKVTEDELLIKLAEKYNKTPAQIALRWLIEQEQVVAIPKSSTREHIAQNIDIYDFFLEDEDFDAIDELDKNRRMINPDGLAPDWD
jgi:2,5-diketo-D-gluconate reductase B